MLFPLSRGLRSSFSRWCSSFGRCHLWFLVNLGRVDTHAVIWWPTSRVNLLGLVPFLADPCEAMWLFLSPLYTILVTSVTCSTSDSSSLRSFVITVVFIVDGDVRFTPHVTLKMWRKNRILKPFQAPLGVFLHFIAASHKSFPAVWSEQLHFVTNEETLKTNYTITVVLWWVVRTGSQVLWRCWFFRRLWASQEHPEHKPPMDLNRLSRISQGGSTHQETNSAVSEWCSYQERSWSCSGWGQDLACPCPGFPIAACAALLAEMLCLSPGLLWCRWLCSFSSHTEFCLMFSERTPIYSLELGFLSHSAMLRKHLESEIWPSCAQVFWQLLGCCP